uniref:DEP domain-containing protein n=1 Tax=Timspurckia oligopyrenoides TaxID=708627 RepID=A0A7S0ZGV4_9RHOD|mmetsp:Transcript_4658/g.8128  ORF Transcript_4658/g.8128 Transcript_4658/m.8128 type:complete len:141 (+) Transcript_4658:192-614(+)
MIEFKNKVKSLNEKISKGRFNLGTNPDEKSVGGASSLSGSVTSVDLEQKFRDLHYVKVSAQAKSEMSLKTRECLGTQVSETFLGSDLVSFLIKTRYCKSAAEATHVGSKLLLYGLIYRVGDEQSETFTCSFSPYKFTFVD